MDKLKVGMIGTGGISHKRIKAYPSSSRAERCALCGIGSGRLDKMARRYGAGTAAAREVRIGGEEDA